MGAACLINGGQLSLSWPGWASGWGLYATTNLTLPAVWSSVTNVVANTNGQFIVTLPFDAGTKFFRLVSP